MKLEEIVRWFMQRRAPLLDRDSVISILNTVHPRTIFLKMLPRNSKVLDLGAGDGSAELFRAWPLPARGDLQMYAYSLEKGLRFDQYDGFELGNWEVSRPSFSGLTFDAIFCSHFIEHICTSLEVVEFAAERLNSGGRFYLEWPSPKSENLPTRDELANFGINLMISNFSDDKTHKLVHNRQQVIEQLTLKGFSVEQEGYVSLPFLEDELLAHFLNEMADPYPVQAAFWSKTKWAQYLVLTKN